MKVIAKIMMVIGILLILLPSLGRLYTKQQQQKMYHAYAAQMEQSMVISNETFDKGVIGTISIPEIAVELMIVEGVDNEVLKFAVGHMPGTALPGQQGNCSLAGHRSYTFGKYFNRLDELEAGDRIYLTYGAEQYTYEVYESFLVKPNQVEVIEPQGKESTLTLITCHPVINPTHRLIVRGKLIVD